MAQKKVNNRQRMINMMYLVLLALLALNVSAEVLNAFDQMRKRLAISAETADQGSMDLLASMHRSIDDEVINRKKMDNAGLKDTLNDIRQSTQQLMQLLNTHIGEMNELADWDSAKHRYTRMGETEKNFQYWMGEEEDSQAGRGNGAAYELREKINRYAAKLAAICNAQRKKGDKAFASQLVGEVTETKEGITKSWERYTFEGPVIANMATLEALKIDIYQLEKSALELINKNRLNADIYVADKLIPISSPLTGQVVAGLPFRTRLNVAFSSNALQPQFYSPSGKISTENNGASGILEVMASGASIPKGKNEGVQHYTATITVPTAKGSEKLELRDKFTVRRPEIVITSGAVQLLYKDCANQLNVDVPALGEYYQPVINASGGEARQSNQNRKRLLVDPQSRVLNLKVATRTNGQTIPLGSQKYRVVLPPKPSIELKANGHTYTGMASISKKSRIYMRIKPDREFAEMFDRDARYRISQVDVLLKDGLMPAKKVASMKVSNKDAVNGFRINLPSRVQQARTGAILYLQIDKVQRKNYKGKVITDKRFTEIERSFAFPLK